MARPGENMVRTAALALMRQYCTDSGHLFVHDHPAIAAAMAAIGAVPERAQPGVINEDGSPHMARRYHMTAAEAYEALQRAARKQRERP